MQKENKQYLVFSLDTLRCAIEIINVECVVSVVEITALPNTPEVVLGLINLKGSIIPVLNMHCRFLLTEREIALSDKLIVIQIGKRKTALLVNKIVGIIEAGEEDIITADVIIPGIESFKGVIRREDGMILVYDPEKLLTYEEFQQLEKTVHMGRKNE
ncbi:MAG: purine-binding chemotaxis protein CheW [Bacteroidetes bacterium]|nr:purine-binding chemotaxis protein CheW [Bacteroidota bacterium]